MYKLIYKRLFDLTVSVLLFIGLFPLFLLIACLLSLEQKGSAFFVQARPGKNGKLFRLIKFRTMHDQKDAAGILLPDAQRFTFLGRLLRRSSLDEIPQLLNVMAGEMSLVGPRPLLEEYLPLYNAFEARRHEVLPGITGWAQVNGRNAISWQLKFAYDCWYVDHVSFKTDLKIIWLTFQKVSGGEGVNAGKEITMEKFTGTPNT